MFTKSQLLAATVIVASATSVSGAPMYNDVTEIEARADASPKAHGEPTGGKGRQQKIKETAEILGAGKGGNGVHKEGTAAPNNSPSGSPAPSRKSSTSSLKTRAILEFLADLEARADAAKAAYGEGQGWITPTGGKSRQQKVKQTAEILAVGKHKQTEPGHPAVAKGNTATVHDSFHSSNHGPVHATVNYKNPEGGHVTTLHIGKDGERQKGNNAAVHKEGTAPPNNTPAGSRKSSLNTRAILGYTEELEAHHGGGHNGGHAGARGASAGLTGSSGPPVASTTPPPVTARELETRLHHEIGKGPSGIAAPPDSPGPVSAAPKRSTVKSRELLEVITRDLELYDDLD